MSSFPWQAEIELDPGAVSAILREQFPELADEPVALVGRGWDNTAYEVGGEAIFRFPRRAVAVELLQRETAVLPLIAPALPLAAPVPRWVGRSSPAFPWPFAGYRRLPGIPAHRAGLGRADRERAAPVLGRFLRALHSLPPDGLPLPGDELDRLDFGPRLPHARTRLDALRARGIIAGGDRWLQLIGSAGSRGPGRGVVVHGDLYAAHLLMDAEQAVCGVIDWGDVHLGDPAVDLMVAFGFLPPGARAAFWAEYGDADAATLDLARGRAAFHAIAVAWYAAETEDAPLLDEALLAMEQALI